MNRRASQRCKLCRGVDQDNRLNAVIIHGFEMATKVKQIEESEYQRTQSSSLSIVALLIDLLKKPHGDRED